jgi:hypothetical protein
MTQLAILKHNTESCCLLVKAEVCNNEVGVHQKKNLTTSLAEQPTTWPRLEIPQPALRCWLTSKSAALRLQLVKPSRAGGKKEGSNCRSHHARLWHQIHPEPNCENHYLISKMAKDDQGTKWSKFWSPMEPALVQKSRSLCSLHILHGLRQANVRKSCWKSQDQLLKKRRPPQQAQTKCRLKKSSCNRPSFITSWHSHIRLWAPGIVEWVEILVLLIITTLTLNFSLAKLLVGLSSTDSNMARLRCHLRTSHSTFGQEIHHPRGCGIAAGGGRHLRISNAAVITVVIMQRCAASMTFRSFLKSVSLWWPDALTWRTLVNICQIENDRALQVEWTA